MYNFIGVFFKLWWPLTGSAFLIGKTNSIFSDRCGPEKSHTGTLAENRIEPETNLNTSYTTCSQPILIYAATPLKFMLLA
jgi:hypothetical protein